MTGIIYVALLAAGVIFLTLSTIRILKNVGKYSEGFISYLSNWYRAPRFPTPEGRDKEERHIEKTQNLFMIGAALMAASHLTRTLTLEEGAPIPAECIFAVGATSLVAFLLFFPPFSKMTCLFLRWFWHKCMD
ncbi:MAG TPA: hypothetical protein DEF59_01405 [Candidatus Magasanikbacteria bacterium]|nr:hypothetical protein [Candidatus Magasanikbacteria bacterium]